MLYRSLTTTARSVLSTYRLGPQLLRRAFWNASRTSRPTVLWPRLWASHRTLTARANTYVDSPEGTVKPREIFIGNLAYGSDESDVQKALEQFGNLTHIRIGISNEGIHRGFAVAEFETEEAAKKAVDSAQEQPILINERYIRVRPSVTSNRPNRVLYFANWDGSEDDLRAHLQKFEEELELVMLMRDSRKQGQGFIRCHTLHGAQQVLDYLRQQDPDFAVEYSHKSR